jgi:hypothetical protein
MAEGSPATTFADYQTAVARAQKRHPEWRRGQTACIVLRRRRPDLAEAVWATPLDAFSQDERLDAFLSYVEEHW